MSEYESFTFPHERWDAFRAAIELDGQVRKVLAAVPRDNHLVDQLERASASISLNIAEGAGEFRPKEKARFYRMALRSTSECAATLELLRPLLATKPISLTPTRDLLAHFRDADQAREVADQESLTKPLWAVVDRCGPRAVVGPAIDPERISTTQQLATVTPVPPREPAVPGSRPFPLPAVSVPVPVPVARFRYPFPFPFRFPFPTTLNSPPSPTTE